MDQPPPDPSRASTPSTAAAPVVVRMRRGSLIYDLALSAAGLAGFLAFRHHPGWMHVFAALGVGGLLDAVRSARFEIEVQDGWLTLRNLSSDSRPVDLRQLITVTTPGPRERRRTGLRYVMLRDKQGTEVRLPLNGTLPSQRRLLLAALEPYMADRVTGATLVREALSGEPWWPRRRLRSGSRRSDTGVRPG
ncbi:MAG TPA: hypothetical protein VGQ05_16025 [Streptosporangiaceae bacterium]|jgi:hypothetical protein|nr:hypothetical protein [Streptosporangiaceae bacterium]